MRTGGGLRRPRGREFLKVGWIVIALVGTLKGHQWRMALVYRCDTMKFYTHAEEH